MFQKYSRDADNVKQVLPRDNGIYSRNIFLLNKFFFRCLGKVNIKTFGSSQFRKTQYAKWNEKSR